LDQSARSCEDLICACLKGGDEAAWREFVRRFRPVIAATIIRTARRYGETQPELIDELVQDTYVKICADRCRILREFRAETEDSIFGFLKTVAFSVAHDHFRGGMAAKRGAGGRETSLDAYLESTIAGREGLPQVEREVLLAQVDDCLAVVGETSVSGRDRQIFWLYYRHGMTSRAIAAIPQIALTQKGVESVIQRLTNLVRQRLAEGKSKANPL
jgi:RNA polymerase sigma-70 factor (ECF subfamily)